MVDAIVSLAIENLLNVAKDEAVQLASLKENLNDLSGDLGMIRAVIKDAEMKQIKDEAITIWLRNLKYVAYDIEDMFEEWDLVRNSSSPFYYAKRLIKQFKFAQKATSIIKKVEKLKSQKDTYGFREISVRETDRERESFAAVVEQSSIFGRDADQEILISKLVENDPSWTEGKIPVISIVGMGGLGKTTLAQLLFNTKRIKGHFEKCIWVFVSNEFKTKDIMIKIVTNGGGGIDKEDTLELIIKKVLKIIENKRYLLILDDVWNEEEQLWEPLQNVLNSGEGESRIIVTTRKTRVAVAIRSVYVHNLEFLPKEDCWLIFKKCIFVKNNEHDQGYNDLEKIGLQIVEKCGGIPLAVKTIASAVRKKAARGGNPTLEQLNDILSNEIWDMPIDSNIGILPALMLSYIELPSALKNCFCYCSLFVKGKIFKKDLLAKLWVAQGYILKAMDAKKDVDYIAQEYFDELLDRSLFQEPVKDKNGMVTSCKMHDRVHDLAQWISNSEFSTLKKKQPGENALMLGDVRHCAILEAIEWKIDIVLQGFENLRTLILTSKPEMPFTAIPRLQSVRVLSLNSARNIKLDGLGRLVHLRYLDLSFTNISSLPRSIGKLKHLLYLDLTGTRISELPQTVTSLSRLQTLSLRYCINLRKLPNRIPAMGSLRHMDVSLCDSLGKLPDGIGRLTLLQKLGKFPVKIVGSGCSDIGELGRLNHLRHELLIDNLEAVASKDEALTAKLRDKTSLKSLCLRWRYSKDGVNYLGVLEGLHGPPGIEKVEIWGYPGEAFPRWIEDATSFLHLCNVTLTNCVCTQLPHLGRLPCLTSLFFYFMRKLEKVGDEFLFGFGGEGGIASSVLVFPKLESLRFCNMRKWGSWTTSLAPPMVKKLIMNEWSSNIMPNLTSLSLEGCPELKEVPSIFTRKVYINIIGCPKVERSSFYLHP